MFSIYLYLWVLSRTTPQMTEPTTPPTTSVSPICPAWCSPSCKPTRTTQPSVSTTTVISRNKQTTSFNLSSLELQRLQVYSHKKVIYILYKRWYRPNVGSVDFVEKES